MPNFKKLISLICALAMSASALVVPVMADEDITAAENTEVIAEETTDASEETTVAASAESFSENFDSYSTGTLMMLGGGQTVYSDIPGMTIYIGSRSSANSTTYAGINSGGYSGNCLALGSGQFSSSNRGPRVAIDGISSSTYVATMKIKTTGSYPAYYGDDTSTQGTKTLDVGDNAWHDLSVYILGSTRLIMLDGNLVASEEKDTIPVIWTEGANQSITTYIDEIVIKELEDENMAELASCFVDLPDENSSTESIVLADDGVTYEAYSDFNVPTDITIPSYSETVPASWKAYDKGSDTTAQVSVDSASGKVTVYGDADHSTPVILEATFTYGAASYTKQYTVNIFNSQQLADKVADELDIANGTTCVLKDGQYNATNAFDVITKRGVASISWSASDEEILKIAAGEKVNTDTITLYPMDKVDSNEQEITTVTLTGTVNYNGAIATKDFIVKFIKAKDLLDQLDIVDSSSNGIVKNDDGTYTVNGDFDVVATLSGATVTWADSNGVTSSTASESDTSKKTIKVYPQEDVASTVLTGTITYGTTTATKDFTLDISDYSAESKEIVDEAMADRYIYYTADTTGTVVKTAAEDGGIIFSDVYLPTTAKVGKKEVELAWSIEENSNLSSDGVITVSDKDKHEVKITKTASYSVNSKVVATATETYTMYVQFDPDYVKTTVQDAYAAKYSEVTPTPTAEPEATATPEATDAALSESAETVTTDAPTEESTLTAAEDDTLYAAAATVAPTASPIPEDTYLRGFLYDYQVKFDAALDSNFDGIPSSVTSSSTFNLPHTTSSDPCYFGSTLDWESSSSSIIKISQSAGTATVTLPSSAADVTLTANVIAGSATPTQHKSSVAVSAKTTSSGSSGGRVSSGGSTRSGGSSSGGSVTSSVITPITSSTSSSSLNPNPSGFTDLDSVSWALTAINNLYVNGVINGKTSTTFAPNDPVTRAEFAKMLILAFNIATVEADNATFSDVPTSNWASPYIEAAYSNGIITGYEDGTFMPDKNVTRQEMAVMVMRAATAEGRSFEAKTEAVTFTDDGVIASYAKDAISTLQQANVISGVGDGSFDPLASSTRAQACQMIYNVFNK